MIEVASEAGADAIKFQTFKAENLVTGDAPKAEYQAKNTLEHESQFYMLKKLELSPDIYLELINHCKKNDIEFLSSSFDIESADLLFSLGVRRFKIPSGEITNLPLLKHIGNFKKEVILSTGMSTIDEIDAAIDILVKAGSRKENIILLHCNTEYPTPFEDVNLNAMLTIHERFKVKTGYSDHSLGIEVPIAAVALGAEVIEKHFTLDKKMDGPDHKASLEPDELKQMVQAIRNIEKSLGDGIKKPSASELKNIKIVRKSIYYSESFKKGHIICESDLIMKRPGTGLSPMQIDLVTGKTLKVDVPKGSILKLEDLI